MKSQGLSPTEIVDKVAFLLGRLERELAHERKNERALAEFEAMRAEAYKYNF